MSAYIVDRAEQVGAPFPTKDGKRELKQIRLMLRDGADQAATQADWYTVSDTQLPASGSTIQGELELTDNGFRFKKASKAKAGDGTRGDLSPEAQARIDATGRAQGRAHAQEMSLRWMALKAQIGFTLTRDDIAPEVLLPIIDWFYKDAQAAKKEPDA